MSRTIGSVAHVQSVLEKTCWRSWKSPGFYSNWECGNWELHYSSQLHEKYDNSKTLAEDMTEYFLECFWIHSTVVGVMRLYLNEPVVLTVVEVSGVGFNVPLDTV